MIATFYAIERMDNFQLKVVCLQTQRNGIALPPVPDALDVGGSAEANIGPQAPGNEMPPPTPRPVETQAEKRSLLVQAAAAKKGKPEESQSEKLMKEEQELLRNITRQKALKGVKELAKVLTPALPPCSYGSVSSWFLVRIWYVLYYVDAALRLWLTEKSLS